MDEPVRYDEDRGVIVIKAPARVSSEVLDEYRNRMVSLPRFTAATPVVVDWSAIDHTALTNELVRERARIPWPVSARIAFYAPSDILFGLARMYALQSHQAIEAFRDCEEAVEWARTHVP